jgi:hypothetical protein
MISDPLSPQKMYRIGNRDTGREEKAALAGVTSVLIGFGAGSSNRHFQDIHLAASG